MILKISIDRLSMFGCINLKMLKALICDIFGKFNLCCLFIIYNSQNGLKLVYVED